MQRIRQGKMWAKIKAVIRHTVVEQRLFGLPVGCSDFPFCFGRVRVFTSESLVYLFAEVIKHKQIIYQRIRKISELLK